MKVARIPSLVSQFPAIRAGYRVLAARLIGPVPKISIDPREEKWLTVVVNDEHESEKQIAAEVLNQISPVLLLQVILLNQIFQIPLGSIVAQAEASWAIANQINSIQWGELPSRRMRELNASSSMSHLVASRFSLSSAERPPVSVRSATRAESGTYIKNRERNLVRSQMISARRAQVVHLKSMPATTMEEVIGFVGRFKGQYGEGLFELYLDPLEPLEGSPTESDQLIWQKINMLTPRGRQVWMLRNVRGLAGSDLERALDISRGLAATLLRQSRNDARLPTVDRRARNQ